MLVLLACCHASNAEPSDPSECVQAILAALGNFEDVINDFVELLKGHMGALSPLISTLKTLASDVATIPSACLLAMVSVNASCLEDFGAIIMTIRNIGSDIGELVKGDIDVISSI